MAETIIVKQFREFVEEQGCDYILVKDDAGVRSGEPNRHYVFANGAQSNGLTQHLPPPDDPQERVRVRVLYLSKALARGRNNVRKCQKYIREQAQWYASGVGPLPAEESKDELRQLTAHVAELERQLAEANAEYQKVKTGPSAFEQFLTRRADAVLEAEQFVKDAFGEAAH